MKSFPSLHYLVVPEPSTLFSLVQKWRKIPSRTKKLRDSFIYEKLLLRREKERKCDGEEGVGRGCIVLFPRSSTHNKSSFPALGNGGNRVSPLFKLLHLPPLSTRSIVARWKEGKWTRGESRGENGKRRRGGGSWIEKLVSFRSLLFQGRKSWERSQQSSSNKRWSSPILESNDECTVRIVLQSFKECEFDLFEGERRDFLITNGLKN